MSPISRAASRSRRRTIRGSAPFREQGAEIYRRRQGQLNLSCAICHDDNAGKKLAGVTIPQAHPTGYPIYRLEWQALGSLKRRLRNCLVGIRAEAYAYDAPEYVALEIYLMDRAKGMVLDAPGVRPYGTKRREIFSSVPHRGDGSAARQAIFDRPFHCRRDPAGSRVGAC